MNKFIFIITITFFTSCYQKDQHQLDEQKKILDSVNKEILNLKKQIQYDKIIIDKLHTEQSDSNHLR